MAPLKQHAPGVRDVVGIADIHGWEAMAPLKPGRVACVLGYVFPSDAKRVQSFCVWDASIGLSSRRGVGRGSGSARTER